MPGAFGCEGIRSADLAKGWDNVQDSLVCHVLEKPLALTELRVDDGEDMIGRRCRELGCVL